MLYLQSALLFCQMSTYDSGKLIFDILDPTLTLSLYSLDHSSIYHIEEWS